jgi:hypothetical protein
MFKFPKLFSFVLAIIPTSVSIPFIIFHVWILTVCYEHEKFYFSLQKSKFKTCNT